MNFRIALDGIFADPSVEPYHGLPPLDLLLHGETQLIAHQPGVIDANLLTLQTRLTADLLKFLKKVDGIVSFPR